MRLRKCKYNAECEAENDRMKGFDNGIWAFDCPLKPRKPEDCIRYDNQERDNAIRISDGASEKHN